MFNVARITCRSRFCAANLLLGGEQSHCWSVCSLHSGTVVCKCVARSFVCVKYVDLCVCETDILCVCVAQVGVWNM